MQSIKSRCQSHPPEEHTEIRDETRKNLSKTIFTSIGRDGGGNRRGYAPGTISSCVKSVGVSAEHECLLVFRASPQTQL